MAQLRSARAGLVARVGELVVRPVTWIVKRAVGLAILCRDRAPPLPPCGVRRERAPLSSPGRGGVPSLSKGTGRWGDLGRDRVHVDMLAHRGPRTRPAVARAQPQASASSGCRPDPAVSSPGPSARYSAHSARMRARVSGRRQACGAHARSAARAASRRHGRRRRGAP